MSQSSIKNVLVLGATGNIGVPIITALLAHPNNYTVTAVTRDASKASFPPTVRTVESDHSPASLRSIFTAQDAIVSCAHATQIAAQKQWIDIAIEAGVRRFLPSEFGMDSAVEGAETLLPLLGTKRDVIKYLQAREDVISWSAVVTGMFFDWALARPFPGSWDVQGRKATVYDDGEYAGEWTNVGKIGEAVAAVLAPEYEGETRNRYVYVNSFTVSQNEVLAVLEEVTGEKFEVVRDTVAGLRERSAERVGRGEKEAGIGLIVAGAYGEGGLNGYSRTAEGGLWNERLGLGVESMEETVRRVLKGAS